MNFIKSLIITSMFFLGCSASVTDNDPYTLYMHLSSDPGTLNPITSSEAITSTINENIYETLVDRDFDTLEIVPQLAVKWKISDDKLRYIFYLRKGVLWSDGVEFTADDVVYSYRVIKDPSTACAPLKVYYIDIRDVRKIDRYTVEFIYTKPYFLGLNYCGSMPIIPKHIFDDGTDFNTHKNNRHPVGTGAYIFKRWDTGKRIVLSANPRYRGKKPDIRNVVFKIVSEPSVALQMLKKGELDVMSVRPIEWVRQTNSESFIKNFYKLEYYIPNYSWIGWNSRTEYFKDKRVRKAMTHLINRDAIREKLLFGLGKLVTGTFYIYSRAYNPDIKSIEYDPEKAKRLLSEAGWRDTDGDGILDRNGKKFSFTFTIASEKKFSERLTSILKEDLARVGIEMNINRYEWAVFADRLHKRNFEAITLSWLLSYSDDPYQLWHSSQVDAGSNFCNFKNREADRIIEKARVEFNDRKRNKIYHRFGEILYDEQPYTFLFCSPSLVAVNKRFTNVKVHLRGLNYLEWMIRDKK
ncbi:MAG: peptide-binding protein [Spirochaetes bacterium]|nr:peptide-binding protein [Spirochaetota bacterium]